MARIEASYYEEMIRLEEGKDSERRSREVDGSYEELLAEVQEWRLRERNSRGSSVKKEGLGRGLGLDCLWLNTDVKITRSGHATVATVGRARVARVVIRCTKGRCG